MGTRNLTCVVQNGRFKVAQYGQWDGYPEGQGFTCLEFLRDQMNEQVFSDKVAFVREISDEELKAKWKECGADDSGWVNMDVSAKFKEKWPHLQRDCAAEILCIIQNSPPGLEVSLEVEFAKSGSCEWAYVIDLDGRKLEVYSSYSSYTFNDTDRFKNVLNGDEPAVRHIVSFPFDSLPSNADFVKTIKSFYPKDEDNEENEEVAEAG